MAKQKLTFTQAEQIRLLYETGYSRRKLADEFGVTKTMVGYILAGKSHVDPNARSIASQTHGQAVPPTRLYQTWVEMRRRCRSGKDFANWGGRGIKVCARWDDFGAFADDMGAHPGKGWSIERKDNDGPYEPGNCVWLRVIHQARNRRDTRLSLEDARAIRALKGQMSTKDLSDKFNASTGAINAVLTNVSWKE